MAKFTVVGPFPAYGVQPGETVELDETDPLVQLNVQGGVIAPGGSSRSKAAATSMRCPLCIERKEKTVPAFKSADDLAAHYADKHEGFAVPPYTPSVEEE